MAGTEPRKVFVGGLPRSVVTPDVLRAHFARYGEVVDAVAMVNPENNLGRGFGFVEFADEDAVVRALDSKERERHVFHGRRVEVKRAQTRSVQTQPISYGSIVESKKIFLGGLRDSISEDQLRDYFQKFGNIVDVVVMYDRITKSPRGFGFVTFDSQEAVKEILKNRFHDLDGTQVETKMAEPRENSWYQKGHNYDHRSPNNRHSGLYSPHNLPCFVQNGHYFVPVYPCIYASPGTVNYGYMMNQTATSNDSCMMTMQGSPMMYASYGYDPVTMRNNYIVHPSSDLSDSKMSGRQQRVDIPASSSMKSDPVKPDSNNLP